MLKNNAAVLGLFALCAFIYFFPALTQTYLFNDDIGRNAVGYGLYDGIGWGEYADSGRPAAEIVIRLLSGWFGRPTDINAVNVAPLTKLISALCVAVTAWVVYMKVINQPSWNGFLVSLTVVFSPWFIHCIQYSFDSVTMGAALVLTVLPFMGGRGWRGYVLFFGCYFASLCFYQLFLVAPFLIIAVLLFKSFFDTGSLSHDLREHYGRVMVALFAGFSAYKLFILLLPLRPYALIHSKLLTLSIVFPAQMFTRLRNLADIFFSPFYGTAGVVLIWLFLCSLCGVAMRARVIQRSVWLCLSLFLLLSGLGLLMALLPQALLRDPLYAGRAMAGNQFVMLIWFFPLVYLRKAAFKYLCTGWILFFTLMASLNAAITGAIRAQYDYEDRLLDVILNYPVNNTLPTKVFIVPPYYSINRLWLRQVRNVRDNFPFTKYILHNTYMLNSSIWPTRQAQLYNRDVEIKVAINVNEFCEWPNKLVRKEFIMYAKDDVRYVDINKTTCDKLH